MISMRKSFLFLVIAISFGSCKSDGTQRNNLGDSETNKTEISATAEGSSQDINTAVATKDSSNTAVSDTESGTTAITEDVSNKSETPKKARKKVKKKSFNPPHIAVLEQDEYEPYEEEVEEQPKKKEVKDKKVTPEKVSTAAEKVKTTKVEAKNQEAKPAAKSNVVQTASKPKVTEIVFKRNFFSFGDIVQGDTVKFNFDFTNIGEVPLIIEDAKGSCSCTHPKYPIIPIQPGESGKITGIYVSDDKVGPQNASVTLTANTEPSTHQLLLDGKVSIPTDDAEEGHN